MLQQLEYLHRNENIRWELDNFRCKQKVQKDIDFFPCKSLTYNNKKVANAKSCNASQTSRICPKERKKFKRSRKDISVKNWIWVSQQSVKLEKNPERMGPISLYCSWPLMKLLTTVLKSRNSSRWKSDHHQFKLSFNL